MKQLNQRLINLTGHPVRIRRHDGTIEVFEPSGQLARVEYEYEKQLVLGGIPVQTSRITQTTGLPEPRADLLFIVSTRVRIGNPTRTDLLSPAELERNAKKDILGCRTLERNAPSPMQSRKGN